MNKDRVTISTVPYVTRAHRQHNSIVSTIPKGICHALGVEAGDILCFDLQCGEGFAKFSIQLKGPGHHGRDSGNSDRKDRGGGS